MKPQKILLVQLGRIGDLILMTPMFKVLKEANQKNELHLLAGRNNYHIAVLHSLLDKVHVFDKNIFKLVKLLKALRREKFDIWMDVKDHYSTESYYFAKFCHAKKKIGYNRKGRSIFDYAIPSDIEQAGRHAVERNLSALKYLNLKLDTKIQQPILFLDSDSEKRLQTFQYMNDISNYICVNISATSSIRYWQNQKWIDFLNFLSEQNKKCLLISLQKDRKLTTEILDATQNVFYFETDSIVDVFSVVKHSEITITPDTSVVHIAAAFDVPVLGLYANIPFNYTKFSPLSSHQRMVFDPKPKASLGEISVDLLIKRYKELAREVGL